MKRLDVRAISTLLLNAAAVFFLLRAGWSAFRNDEFMFTVLFAIVAVAYSVGFVMQASGHRLARATNVRLQVAGVYLFTALMTFVSVNDLMYMANASGEPYRGWWHAVLVLSSVGSMALAIACVSALIEPHYGHIVTILGVSLSWPYFACVAWNLPWHDFAWLVTIHWDGRLNVEAVLSLVVTTVCSIGGLIKGRPPRTRNASPEMA